MSERVSLILPTYVPDAEVAAHQQAFLDSLGACTRRSDYQFIVIENGSQTSKLAGIADIYIHKPQPVGYARAVNIGVSLADEQLLVVVNNDIVLSPEWLPRLVADYREFGPGILSPMHYAGAPPGIHYDDSWWSLVITDRETWATVGYLNERLAYRLQDQEWSIRARQGGFSVMRTGNVVVGHSEASTYKKMALSEQEQLERRWMRQRYGVEHFCDWVARQ